jgi:hypothetical protein
MSRKKKIARALAAGVALYGASKLMGMGAKKTGATGASGKQTVSDAQKTTQVKKLPPKRVVDLKNPESSIVGQSTKISVDKNANPREIKEISSAAKAKKAEQFKIVKQRKDAGKLSPLMPKSESQYKAMTKENSGLGMFDGAKKGKMVRARGGGLAKGGMRPTKLY